MSEYLRRNVLGVVAIFIALSGTAAALPGKNKVDSGDIKNANVRAADLAANSVDGSKVADDALKGADVDESSLNIPQQALPTSLPPSGAAGGDLSGSYPDPQVSEAGLGLGGDLSGSVANAQLAAGTVGDAELANRTRSLVFSASEIADAGVLNSIQGEPTITENFLAPALGFADAGFTDIALDTVVPADRVPGSDVEVRVLWCVRDQPPAGQGDVIWRAEALSVGPGEAVDNTMNPQVQAPAQDAGTADDLRIQTIDLPGANIRNGELMLLRILRMAGAGAEFAEDDLAQNALLLAVEVRYQAVS